MIDYEMYRCRVGLYNGKLCSKSVKCNGESGPDGYLDTYKVSITGNCGTDQKFYSISKFIFVSVIYVYFMLCVLGSVIGMLTESKLKSFRSLS